MQGGRPRLRYIGAMRDAMRWLVAGLLALAVPMKAIAMVLGSSCLPWHGMALPAHTSGHPGHHHADSVAPHQHPAHHHSAAADGIDSIDGIEANGRIDAKPASMKCSACAPCCAAIVGPVVALWQAPAAGHALATAELALRLGVVPRLAHPPPRRG